MRSGFGVVLVALCGCVGTGGANGERLTRVTPIVQRHGVRIISPYCGVTITAPSLQTAKLHGVSVRQPCGMLFVATAGESYASFSEQRCAGLVEQECSDKFSRMLYARVTERYPLADVPWILNHCEGYPDECDTPAEIETWHLITHNANVEAALDGELSQSDAAHEKERAEKAKARRKLIGQAFEDLGKSMQQMNPPTINCTSHVYGNTVNTSCR